MHFLMKHNTFFFLLLYITQDPTTGGIRQLWYDDPESLMIRYSYAKSNQLRGVSMWNADFLDYTGDPVGRALTKAMWDAINSFFL